MAKGVRGTTLEYPVFCGFRLVVLLRLRGKITRSQISSTRALQLKSIAKDNRGRRKVKEHNGQVHQKEIPIAVELLLLWAARVSTP